MNIKIIILIVLIIILIIIGCWYIVNLYNKEKSKNDDESDTNFWKTYGGKITYTKDNTKAIIPISNTNKNTFSMPRELFINIVKFLNAFNEKYNEILKSKDNQNKINELWVLKYKLNIYKSELEYNYNHYLKLINDDKLNVENKKRGIDTRRGKEKENTQQRKQQFKRKITNTGKKENTQQRKQQLPKLEITEEMKNELGNKLYNIIENMNYKKNEVEKITGVMLESIDYDILEKMIKENQDELKKAINDTYNVLNTIRKKQLYKIINEMNKYSKDDITMITNIIMASYDYNDIEKMIKENQDKLRKAINDTYELMDSSKKQLGNKLYKIIKEMGKYSDYYTAMIANIIMASHKYNVLKNMVDENGDELKKSINDTYESLKKHEEQK